GHLPGVREKRWRDALEGASMRLVERADELASLHRAFTAARSGDGQVVVVSGLVGTGKTALLQTFGNRIAEAGAIHLHATASRSETSLPLSLVRQLFRSPHFAAATVERAGRLLDGRLLV